MEDLRTQEEIVSRLNDIGKFDIMGSMTSSDLLIYLEWGHAQEFLKEDVTQEYWEGEESGRADYTEENVLKEMEEYITFAWEKAIDERGLSANRSIAHFHNWLWLIKDDEMCEFLDEEDNFSMYGKPMLREICKKYGYDIPKDA